MNRLSKFLCVLFVCTAHSVYAQKKVSTGVLHCPNTHFSFDTLGFAAPVVHEFMCINTGAQPLKIVNIRPSCSCSVTQWDRQPIAPGDTTYIWVKYDSRRSGEFFKDITVYPNTKQKELQLSISGVVRDNLHKFIIE